MEIAKKLHKCPYKICFRNGIYSLPRVTSFTTYRYFAGQLYLLASQSRSRTEYLITTDNIIVLDQYFYLRKTSNLIGRL